jgi:hypothetical protein
MLNICWELNYVLGSLTVIVGQLVLHQMYPCVCVCHVFMVNGKTDNQTILFIDFPKSAFVLLQQETDWKWPAIKIHGLRENPIPRPCHYRCSEKEKADFMEAQDAR